MNECGSADKGSSVACLLRCSGKLKCLSAHAHFATGTSGAGLGITGMLAIPCFEENLEQKWGRMNTLK